MKIFTNKYLEEQIGEIVKTVYWSGFKSGEASMLDKELNDIPNEEYYEKTKTWLEKEYAEYTRKALNTLRNGKWL